MVVNLKMQLESYSNDQLMQTLANEQDAPAEILDLARAIILERGLSNRNILDRANTFNTAKKEAALLVKENRSLIEIIGVIRDKYYMEETTAQELVENVIEESNGPVMMKCLRFFMLGIVLFYAARITYNII